MNIRSQWFDLCLLQSGEFKLNIIRHVDQTKQVLCEHPSPYLCDNSSSKSAKTTDSGLQEPPTQNKNI